MVEPSSAAPLQFWSPADNQLRDLPDQQIRDLFAYLRSTQPLADRN